MNNHSIFKNKYPSFLFLFLSLEYSRPLISVNFSKKKDTRGGFLHGSALLFLVLLPLSSLLNSRARRNHVAKESDGPAILVSGYR